MNIISLFSGAGGLDLGLVQEGHKIVWANDDNGDCVKTYAKNIGDHIFLGDICEVKLSEIPDSDVIVGGFPCQGFSIANRLRKVDDSRNILYKEFVRIIQGKMPKYFLAENVRGILSLGEGMVINKIIQDFSMIGYKVEYKLFNLADYGVPQTRQRVIIAGTRNDISTDTPFKFPEATHAKDPRINGAKSKGLKKWISIADALHGIPEPGEGNLINHYGSNYKITNRNFTGHRTTDPCKPSPTILARGNGKGGVCAIQHPNNHRRLTIRESAIIQTFPMDFEFVGPMNSCYRQIGNAVPVLFGRLLGQKLRECEKQLKVR